MQRTFTLLIGASYLAVGTSALAQCLIDTDADGHPLFQPLCHRVDVEFIEGVKMISRPTDMAFGDLDGDGDLDGAFAMAQAGGIAILNQTYMTVALNRGDGVFDAPTPYFAGQEVCGVALGDVDADADLDVAVTNAVDGTVSVFLNNGDSTLGPEAVYPVGTMPRSLHAVDLNDDGFADIAALNVESEDVSILLAAGDGTFGPESRFDVGVVTPRHDLNETFPVPGPFMAAADLDADGDIDLAVPAKSALRILRNDGLAGFTLDSEEIDAGPEYTYDVVAADLNADGRIDLAASTDDKPGPLTVGLVVTLQAENGTFPPASEYSGDFLGVGPGQQYQHVALAAGDIDLDGDPDLAVGQIGRGMVGLYSNQGDGTFADAVVHLTCDAPWVLSLEDVTGDGNLDFVHLNDAGMRRPMRIHAGDGHGAFIGSKRSPETGEIDCFRHHAAAPVDLDLDGDLDALGGLFNTSCSPQQIALYENDGHGNFGVAGAVSLVPFNGGAIVEDLGVADMNGDGWPDVVAADDGQWDLTISYPGSLWVLLNDGDFGFHTPVEAPLDTKPYRITLGDFDADGDVDAAAAAHSIHPGNGVDPEPRYVEVFHNDGSGALTHTQTILLEGDYPTEGINSVIANADLDGDGDLDLLATVCSNFEPSRLIRLDNDGNGSFSIVGDDFVGHYPSSIRPGDFDLDGDVDVALMYGKLAAQALGYDAEQEPYLTIYHNDSGVLTLAQEHNDLRVRSNRWLNSADFNADGFPDLAMDVIWGGFVVQLNNGDGTFSPGVGYDQLEFTAAQAVGDFTGDGRPDILGAANTADGVLMLLENASCPPCPADINADGSLNILDFVAFQQSWLTQDPAADCDQDGGYTPLDFACFQQVFLEGCR